MVLTRSKDDNVSLELERCKLKIRDNFSSKKRYFPICRHRAGAPYVSCATKQRGRFQFAGVEVAVSKIIPQFVSESSVAALTCQA